MMQRKNRPTARCRHGNRSSLRRAIEGKANKEIAQEIALSPASVKLYIVALMDRSGARNRVALAASSSLLMSA